ncbi:unnamed protein product [Cunninghamella blakesleeana]
MTMNKLLQAVRSLTMEEFCNKYGADIQSFLTEETRKRKRTDFINPKKSSIQEVTDVLLPTSNSRSDSLEVDNRPNKKEKRLTLTNGKNTITSSSIINPASSSSSSISGSSNKVKTILTATKGISKEINNQPNKGGEDDSTIFKKSQDQIEDEDISFGPLFMQFTKPNHPKVVFQLDPQEEFDETSSFELNIPYEFINQFQPGHRRRIIDQIEHIQDQLEILKNRVKSPSLSPSL